jgi:hypothetical protein
MLRSSLLLLALICGMLAAAAFGREPGPSPSASVALDPQGADPTSPNPLLGLKLWVDEDAPLVAPAAGQQGQGRHAEGLSHLEDRA